MKGGIWNGLFWPLLAFFLFLFVVDDDDFYLFEREREREKEHLHKQGGREEEQTHC